MLRRDAEHRGAEATGIVERDDLLAFGGEFLAHAIHEMNFRAHGEARARRRFANNLEQPLGRANVVGLLANFETAFRMDDNPNAWIFCADIVDMFREKTLVNRAVSLPQNDFRRAQTIGSNSAVNEIRIPNHHFVERNAERMTRVAPEVLIGKKEQLRTF